MGFVGAALTGTATALNASKREESARTASIGYDALAREASVIKGVDLSEWPPKAAREALDFLCTWLNDIAGLPSRKSIYTVWAESQVAEEE